jgi:LysM repeat protein
MAANAVVIQSAPDEFAWYVHLAPNSVPDWIVEGAAVPAGADIGLEGRTGWASLPHLHFMVANWFRCCDGQGDSRLPFWPINSTYRVDFAEYAWEGVPWVAISQNGAASAPPPPAPTEPPPNPPAPNPTQPPAPPAAAPAVPTAAPAPASACPNPYIVQRGEWLLKIAEQCRVSLAGIVAANPGLRPQLIYAGQALKLPGGAPAPAPAVVAPQPTAAAAAVPAAAAGPCSGTHVVARGENLFRIAFNCGLTTAQLAAANGIGSPFTIFTGQTLRFP